LTERADQEQRFRITNQSVILTNQSDRVINKAIVAFTLEGGGGLCRIDSLAGPIPIGEAYKLVGGGEMSNPQPITGAFIVRLLGVEFADGSHWIAPRIPQHRLIVPYFHRQQAPLAIKKCSNLAEPYTATIALSEDGVTAYQLGVVRDTPNGFEVYRGRWVEVPAGITTKNQSFTIQSGDATASLRQAEIFKKELHIVPLRDGTEIRDRNGVALFIAAARLADSTIWQQHLRRDELLWQEIKQ